MSTLLVLALLGSLLPTGVPVELYVAPEGNDSNPGTRAAPLRTLTGARNRVRSVLRSGRAAVTVTFALGVYDFEAPVSFGSEDSGTPEAPIVYRAENPGAVRFRAGRVVRGWRPVRDRQTLQRIAPAARGHVVVADLKRNGIATPGKLTVRGFGQRRQVAEAELFCDGKPATLARYPNEGFLGLVGKLDDVRLQVDIPRERLERWSREPEPWVMAYWKHDWAELYEPLAAIEPTAALLIRRAAIKPIYGIEPRRARWYVSNLLCELDRPGEYYIDRQRGLVYFWPPEPGAEVVLSQGEGFLRLHDVRYVEFRGFVMEYCRGTAIEISGGEACRVARCTVRNTGLAGIVIRGGREHEVTGCVVVDCGSSGISASGGHRPTLTAAGHRIERNHVYRFARRWRTYQPGITVAGVGNQIRYNIVHDAPHMALSAAGNDHVVEFNEIFRVVYESGDAGAYYVGRDWTQRGTVLRHNYWHDIRGYGGLGGMTVYLDDQMCGHTIYGNLFVDCSRAVFIGGGDDNVVDNNVFVRCWKAAHVDNRGMTWQKAATDDPNGTLRRRLLAVPYRSELWRRRYPTLANILSDDPGVPKRNVFVRNISAGGIWDDIYPAIRHLQRIENNLVFDDDPTWVMVEYDSSKRPVRLRFKDPAAVRRIGFRPLPLEQIAAGVACSHR